MENPGKRERTNIVEIGSEGMGGGQIMQGLGKEG